MIVLKLELHLGELELGFSTLMQDSLFFDNRAHLDLKLFWFSHHLKKNDKTTKMTINDPANNPTRRISLITK
ncbi:MAG: hypothetical protein A2136_05830 [Chloroflexi bacterium RBG_16_54_11]|nr:MAG: hypothetical protein A2136_05830 [Chloroflexi bacterium RBG_16_54_11]